MAELCKVERKELPKLPNPHYADLIKRYRHLRGLILEDNDQKKELPVRVILGASDYSRIKAMTKPRIGQPGKPAAEQTQPDGPLSYQVVNRKVYRTCS